jgi:hypothetical protein
MVQPYRSYHRFAPALRVFYADMGGVLGTAKAQGFAVRFPRGDGADSHRISFCIFRGICDINAEAPTHQMKCAS